MVAGPLMPNLARFIASLPTLDLTGAFDILLVAFVFPVLIVHHHQNAAGTDFIDSLGDGHEGHTLYYGGTGFSL